jgi:hypothetical protein
MWSYDLALTETHGAMGREAEYRHPQQQSAERQSAG